MRKCKTGVKSVLIIASLQILVYLTEFAMLLALQCFHDTVLIEFHNKISETYQLAHLHDLQTTRIMHNQITYLRSLLRSIDSKISTFNMMYFRMWLSLSVKGILMRDSVVSGECIIWIDITPRDFHRLTELPSPGTESNNGHPSHQFLQRIPTRLVLAKLGTASFGPPSGARTRGKCYRMNPLWAPLIIQDYNGFLNLHLYWHDRWCKPVVLNLFRTIEPIVEPWGKITKWTVANVDSGKITPETRGFILTIYKIIAF